MEKYEYAQQQSYALQGSQRQCAEREIEMVREASHPSKSLGVKM